jgi:hypothetical protein
MRFLIGALAVVAAGTVTLAVADPPAAPAAAAAPTAATDSAAANTASATSAASTPSADDKALRAQGFKPKMRSGQKLYCREEPMLGSRVQVKETCGTPEQLKNRTDSARDATEQSQRIQVNKTGS